MKIHDQIKNSNNLIRIFDLRKKRCCQSCSLRSKRFWLVSEQRKTEERALRFGCSRIETRALLLAPFFALSLTLVPCSLLQDRTETLATQATKRGSFTIYGKTHYHGLRHATFDVLRVFWSLISSGGNLNWRTQRIIGQTKTSLAKK